MRSDSVLGSPARRWGAAVVALVSATATALVASMRRNDGQLVYAVDDAYIHLAMASNLAHHGTWGVVKGRFDAASSSPLWTLALAGVVRLSSTIAEWAPLGLQVAPALWVVWRLVQLADRGPFGRSVPGRLAVVVAPLALGIPALALTGMEHVLHAALVVEALFRVDRFLAGRSTRADRVVLAVVVAAAVAVRFESLFVIAGLLVGLAITTTRRRWAEVARWLSPALVASTLVLVAAVGFDLAGSGRPMPNSVTAKSALATGHLLDSTRLADNLTIDPLFTALVLLSLVVGLVLRRRDPRSSALALTVAGAGVLHVVFAAVGVYDRYEGYLVVAAGYVLLHALEAAAAPTERRIRAYAIALVVLAAFPKLLLLAHEPDAANGIHRQQEQLGRFFARYYTGTGVGANDIGEVAYRHDGDLLDFEGLGDTAVLDERIAHGLSPAFLEREVADRRIEAIAVFERFYRLPTAWERVGQWCLEGAVYVNGDRCVTWFAPSSEAADRLRQNLADFASRLPHGVRVVG